MGLVIEKAHLRKHNTLGDKSFVEACCILHTEELAAGFVTDDLTQLDYFRLSDPSGRDYLLLQHNPRRGARPQGSIDSGGCRICPNNFSGTSGGGQQFFAFRLNGRLYIALANPFPFMPRHLTIASAEHEPQSWRTDDPSQTRGRILRIVRDLVSLSRNLPGFITIYNAPGAGASMPHHFHFQAFQLPDGHGPLPIQLVAAKHMTYGGSNTILSLGFGSDYPLFAFRLAGSEEVVTSAALGLMERWGSIQGEAAAGNLIAVTEGEETCVYYVPRNRLFKKAAGFNGQIGSTEVCGLFVCSSDWELEAIRAGRMSYGFLWRLLEAVRPPAARQLR